LPTAEPEELLQLMGIGGEQLAELPDAKPLDARQQSLIARVLMRLDGLGPMLIERWSRPGEDVAHIVADPASARGRFFSLAGMVKSVETVELSPEDAKRFMFKRYYRAQMLLDTANAENGKRTVVILTRSLPRQWLKQKPLDARATAFGLFLRLTRIEPVFAAPRIAWHPATPLGELGMDVGLLDTLRDRHKIGPRQRQCFYQMLAAVGRAKPGRLLRVAREELKKEGKTSFSAVPLFNDPGGQRGRLVSFTGTARRVVEVRVQDPDIVERFGIRHYYEIYLYTPDSQDNPLVFCVRELPKGMPAGSDPRYSEQIEVAGFFLQTWSYRPELANEPDGNPDARQLAPLLIGRAPRWWQPSRASAASPWRGLIAGGLFVIVLAAIWLAVWRSAKKDRQFQRERRRKDS
jgi:hypothetical protein